jgi:hypothetical protein
MQASHPIMLIRHAEKPLPDPRDDDDMPGSRGRHGLSVRGERRASMLAGYFAPADGVFADSRIRTPQFIFAGAATLRRASTRPADTVWPLAAALGLAVRDEFSSDPPLDAVTAALVFSASRGAVLASWRHDTLAELARAIGARAVPAEWPEDRFDMVWLLRKSSDGWSLAQIPQLLMPGDSETPIEDGQG